MKSYRVVVATRPRVYPRRSDVYVQPYIDARGRRKTRKIDDPGGVGTEIVREVVACATCAWRGVDL